MMLKRLLKSCEIPPASDHSSARTNRDNLAVFAFPVEFATVDSTARAVTAKNRFPVRRILVNVQTQIQLQQFLSGAVTQHGDQCWVRIQQNSVRLRLENAVGRVLEQMSVPLL